jgi:hypothetical protein
MRGEAWRWWRMVMRSLSASGIAFREGKWKWSGCSWEIQMWLILEKSGWSAGVTSAYPLLKTLPESQGSDRMLRPLVSTRMLAWLMKRTFIYRAILPEARGR